MDKKVVLITGASSGIGKSTAELLLKNNYIVYGAARSLDKMNDLLSEGGRVLFMDVTDEQTISDGIDRIIKEQGKIDILINNAGYGAYGALEKVPIQEAQRQMDVNVFGVARLIQKVLPHMRRQKEGRIINISSIAGKLTSPLGAWYFASKHALEGLSDSLRQELKLFGIDVILIEPGGVKSEWAHIAADHLKKTSQKTPYEAMAQKITRLFPFIDQENADPEVIALLILKVIRSRNPKARYVGGKNARLFLLAHLLLPDKMFDHIVLSQLK